jgi:hypothetical protein
LDGSQPRSKLSAELEVSRGEQTIRNDLDLLLVLPTTNRQVLLNAAIEADSVFWNAPFRLI